MSLTGADLPPSTNELTATRVLYRAAIFAIAMVALALLLLQLKFVIIQVFAAVIVAAGMARSWAAPRTRGARISSAGVCRRQRLSS